jgi:hypothetical protein
MNINLQDIAAQILVSRTVSSPQQQLIEALLSQEHLDEQERILIKRLSYGIRRGLLTVVD